MLQSILLQTDAVAESTIETVENVIPHEEKLNILSLLFAPGTIWITIPLLISVGVIVYIFVERYLTLKKASKEDTNFMNNIRDFMHNNRSDAALTLCKSTNTPLARMIEKGLSRLGKPLQDISETINNVGQIGSSPIGKRLEYRYHFIEHCPHAGIFRNGYRYDSFV